MGFRIGVAAAAALATASFTLLGLAQAADKAPTLVFLSGTKVLALDADGNNLRTLAEGDHGGLNDGVAYDPRTKQIYWTNMGRANADDGTVEKVSSAGGKPVLVVPPGGAFTPKQMKLDLAGGKMYWSDREGMRVMRANLDGSDIEVLVQTGAGDDQRKDQARWCVGIALDMAKRQVYWTQKGGDDAGVGVIRRASIDIPKGQTAASRTDIETLFSNLPEPIDLDLDLKKRQIYWTDRGDNTVSRAPMDPAKGYDPAHRSDRQVLVRGLKEAIGVVLDLPRDRMYYTSLGGEVGTARLNGADAKMLLTDQRTLTGITLIE